MYAAPPSLFWMQQQAPCGDNLSFCLNYENCTNMSSCHITMKIEQSSFEIWNFMLGCLTFSEFSSPSTYYIGATGAIHTGASGGSIFIYFFSVSTFLVFLFFAVSGLPEYCSIFYFPFCSSSVRSSQAWHLNFSGWFDSFENPTFFWRHIIWADHQDHPDHLDPLTPTQCSPIHPSTTHYRLEQPSIVKNSRVEPSIAQCSPLPCCPVTLSHLSPLSPLTTSSHPTSFSETA